MNEVGLEKYISSRQACGIIVSFTVYVLSSKGMHSYNGVSNLISRRGKLFY